MKPQATTNIPSPIDNSEDIIDSRDVIERIEWLEGTDDTDEQGELETLKALAEEAEGYAPDWQYGEALIRESYFAEYAIEMLVAGELPSDIPWYIEIDEEATARNIQMDYTEVDFDGVSYWIR